ncbi:MAG: DUF1440 domain-containing protein [Rhodospirillaceae bacterium]|nr:DUF1440 domain-containing protein [Rhodospirillaceae bacterium]
MNLRGAPRTILAGMLIVGAMDFAYASLATVLRGGSFTRLWQFVGSGLLGKAAFEMGVAGVLCGVACHFLIMGAFAAAICLLYKKVPLIEKQPMVSGVLYGIGIWLVMNFVVVPLSNTGTGAPPMALNAVMNLGFAMHLVIGLSLVLIARRGLRPA